MRILCVIRWNISRPSQFVESELLCLGEVCCRECTVCAHPVVSKNGVACRCEMCTEGQFRKRFRMPKSTSVSVTVSTDQQKFQHTVSVLATYLAEVRCDTWWTTPCTYMYCLCQQIRHLRNHVRKSELEGIPQIFMSRIHPLFDCMIVWQ